MKIFRATLLLFPALLAGASQEKRPNVLFISVDDQNDWIGCLGGHPQAKTPHIDALARRGTLFANAHCQAPLCNPSRTSLLTGLRPSTTGVYALAPWFRSLERFQDHVTLPRHFAAHGYRTLSGGKIYHGGYGRTPDEEFQVLGPGSEIGAKPPKKLVKTPDPHPLVDWGSFEHRDEDKGDWTVASWAVEQIESAPKDRPFFLAAGFFLPHVPCYATKKWFDLYPEDGLQLPPLQKGDRRDTPRFSWYLHWKLPEPRLKFLEEADQLRAHVRAYLACVSFVDSQVGRLLDALKRSGREEDTIVVLWSDHGYHLGEKEISGKNTLWERSTRVPLIFAGPGVATGAVCRRPAELLDLYPTLAELAGLPAPKGLDGHSLLPQLKDAAAPRPWPAITTANRGNHAVRSERWRYIRYADGSEELYDHEADPNEWTNRAGDASLAAVLEDLRKWLPASDAPLAPRSKHRDLTFEGGRPIWEGRPIGPDDPIPD